MKKKHLTMGHIVGDPPRKFDTLHAALKFFGSAKLTGYIVDPNGGVINIRKGKRKTVDGKWMKA